jgi:adenosylcobinamide-phosphate synthase
MITTNFIIAFFAYLIDRFFGEFRFMKHPVIRIGEVISFFEEKFYKESVFRGFLLVLFVLTIVSIFVFALTLYLQLLHPLINIIISSFIASIFIAHNMLRSSVLQIITSPDQKKALSMLVSRDTQDLTQSEICKAAIETYAENLSDGVVAPLFYLILFGLPGIVLYKTINTLDSMVGYRTKRYEKYGKVAAKLDDIANYIPSRLTALLIMLFAKRLNIFAFYQDGSKHESPNAGHPITAMALALDIQLGGDTSYFGKVKKKATFGSGRSILHEEDIQKALAVL